MIVFEVTDDELLVSLQAQVTRAGIQSGAIVSLIGAVDAFTVSTMPADDATKDVITQYNQPAEMHGSGEIQGGMVHVHATLAVEGDRGVSGHLHAAQVGTWFVRAYVVPV